MNGHGSVRLLAWLWPWLLGFCVVMAVLGAYVVVTQDAEAPVQVR